MATYVELADLSNTQERSNVIKFITTSSKSSMHTLSSGSDSDVFYDIDAFLFSKEDFEDIAKFFVKAIKVILKKYYFDKIAIIDKYDGPIGLIPYFSYIQSHIDKNLLIIRLGKRLNRSNIKGNFVKGDKVLILNDVATTGGTIFKAAETILKNGGLVPGAFVYLDRSQGATDNLNRKGIQLYSITSLESIKKTKKIKMILNDYTVDNNLEKSKKHIPSLLSKNYMDLGRLQPQITIPQAVD